MNMNLSIVAFGKIGAKLVGVVWLLLSVENLWGQSRFQFDHLTAEDGLLDNMNFAIFQDSKGYVWIGGKAGVQRYDGYEFLDYTYDPRDPENGLQEMRIRHITEDAAGTIWVGTAGGGIARIRNGRLLPHLTHDPDDPQSLAGLIVEDIIQDPSTGGMWIATNQGLDYYKDGVFTHHTASDPQGISDNRVFSLEIDREGRLWVGTQNGLNLHLGNGQFRQFFDDPSDPQGIGGNFIHALMQDSKGRLWIAIIQGGVSAMNLNDFTCTNYRHDPSDRTSLGGNVPLNFAEDHEGNIWVAAYGGGLSRFRNGQFEVFRNDPLDNTTIMNDNVEEVMVDRNGNVWTANYLGGVNRFAERSIVSYAYNKYKDQGMVPIATLTHILHDSRGAVWLGISSGGLNRYINGRFEQFSLDPEGNSGLGSLRINSIIEDRLGRVWIANQGSGVDVYDQGTFTHFVHDPQNPEGIHSSEVFTVAEDKQGNMWFGSWNGLSVYDQKRFTRFAHDPDDPNSLSSNSISDIFGAEDGRVWVATEDGLNVFKEGRFTRYRHDPDHPTSIPKNNIHTVVVDRKGRAWVGFDGGVARMDPSSEEFTMYGVSDGLAGPIVEDMTLDADDHVWVATHDGASKFNEELNGFETFTTKQGFIDNSILRLHGSKTDRRVYFGSASGFYFLDIDQEVDKEESATLTFTDFSLIDQSSDSVKTAVRERFLQGENVVLKYNQNSFEIKFAALSSEIAPSHLYSYRMKNLNDEWSFPSTKNMVTYTYLEPGEYTFEVRLLSAGQSQTEQLQFTIHTPWWKTIWFRLVIFGCVVTLVIGFYRWKLNQERQQQADLEEKIREAQDHAQTQNQALVFQSQSLQSAIEETNEVVREAVGSGNYSARIQTDSKDGAWKDLGDSINELFDSVARPFNRLNTIVNSMAEGDLTARYLDEATGEIKALSDHLNGAMDNLCHLLSQISGRADEIQKSTAAMVHTNEEMNISAEEIASSIAQMSEGASQQVLKVDESSRLIEGILHSSNEVGDQAKSIQDTAKKGVMRSNKGMELIGDLDTNMTAIQQFSKRTNESISTLTSRSEEISGVLRIIKEIAAQTNLLALNAAIEAAQAGDAGRGFAVVAEEIRKLAEGSKQSAAEIEELIFGVQEETRATATLVTEMGQKIQAGGQATEQSLGAFEEIARYYDETLAKSEEIVKASARQTDEISDIVGLIGNIVVIAEQTAAGTSEASSSSSELSAGMVNYMKKTENVSAIASELKGRVGKFKLPEATDQPTV